MDQGTLDSYVGKRFCIRGIDHLCIASGKDALLLLQLAGTSEKLFKEGDPVQYVIA